MTKEEFSKMKQELEAYALTPYSEPDPFYILEDL